MDHTTGCRAYRKEYAGTRLLLRCLEAEAIARYLILTYL